MYVVTQVIITWLFLTRHLQPEPFWELACLSDHWATLQGEVGTHYDSADGVARSTTLLVLKCSQQYCMFSNDPELIQDVTLPFALGFSSFPASNIKPNEPGLFRAGRPGCCSDVPFRKLYNTALTNILKHNKNEALLGCLSPSSFRSVCHASMEMSALL